MGFEADDNLIRVADLNALYELEAAVCRFGNCIGAAGVVVNKADSPIVFLVNNFFCLIVFWRGLRLENKIMYFASKL